SDGHRRRSSGADAHRTAAAYRTDRTARRGSATTACAAMLRQASRRCRGDAVCLCDWGTWVTGSAEMGGEERTRDAPPDGPAPEPSQPFYGFDEDTAEVAVPAELPILPLRGVVIFPSAIVPLLISRGPSLKLVEDALEGDRHLGLMSQKNPEDEAPTI